ncbi:MarR family transcriptional regulator [Glycocaulis sp.]
MTDEIQTMRTDMGKRARSLFDIPALEKWVLVIAAEHVDENAILQITPSYLARLVNLTSRTVSGIIKRLESKGLVERRQLDSGYGSFVTAYIRLTLPEADGSLDVTPRTPFEEALLGPTPTSGDQTSMPRPTDPADDNDASHSDESSEGEDPETPDEATQRQWIETFVRAGGWLPAWGPSPGTKGCRVSADILREYKMIPYEDRQTDELDDDIPF